MRDGFFSEDLDEVPQDSVRLGFPENALLRRAQACVFALLGAMLVRSLPSQPIILSLNH